MTLAPLRGAPPGASIPGFPMEETKAKPAQPAAAANVQPQLSQTRQPQTPIEIHGSGITLKYQVLPELPAIRRSSMSIHVVADPLGREPARVLGSLQMSIATAEAFLKDLRDGRSPSVAAGDEKATVGIEYAITKAGPTFAVRKPGDRHVLCNVAVAPGCDIKAMANHLLADLGT